MLIVTNLYKCNNKPWYFNIYLIIPSSNLLWLHETQFWCFLYMLFVLSCTERLENINCRNPECKWISNIHHRILLCFPSLLKHSKNVLKQLLWTQANKYFQGFLWPRVPAFKPTLHWRSNNSRITGEPSALSWCFKLRFRKVPYSDQLCWSVLSHTKSPQNKIYAVYPCIESILTKDLFLFLP